MLNGAKIHRSGNTIFVALPAEARLPMMPALCSCAYCKSHPDQKPMWDTLAIGADAPEGRTDTAFTVHFPEFARK